MSPSNRANPTVTDAIGFYRWDVVAGYYLVRASAPGCPAPGNPLRAHVDSAVLPVPPPQLAVALVLACGAPRPLPPSAPAPPSQAAVPAHGFPHLASPNPHQ